jgi:hypothetical protein
MFESELVFGRPSDPYGSVEVPQVHAAVPKGDASETKRSAAFAADDRASAKPCQVYGQRTRAAYDATHRAGPTGGGEVSPGQG